MSTVKIPLTGRWAVGHYAFAIVDEADAARCMQFRWKAGKTATGGRSYAQRNTSIGGRRVTVLLHRFILGYGGPETVDHINHNSMDCRRGNLRIVSKAVNTLNRAPAVQVGTCAWCGCDFQRIGDAGGQHNRRYCSDACLSESLRHRSRERNARWRAKKSSGPPGETLDVGNASRVARV